MLFSPHTRPHNIDLTAHFPHAPTHRCICQQARSGNPRVTQPPLPLRSIKGSTGARCGVRLSVWGIGTPSLFTHQFQANGAAAVAEWRQLLSA